MTTTTTDRWYLTGAKPGDIMPEDIMPEAAWTIDGWTYRVRRRSPRANHRGVMLDMGVYLHGTSPSHGLIYRELHGDRLDHTYMLNNLRRGHSWASIVDDDDLGVAVEVEVVTAGTAD